MLGIKHPTEGGIPSSGRRLKRQGLVDCNLIRLLFQCDAESNYLEQQYFNSQQQQHLPPTGSSTSSLPGGGVLYHPAPGPPGGPGGNGQQPGGNQIDVVLSEVRDFE